MFGLGGQQEELEQLHDILEEQKAVIIKLTEDLDRVAGNSRDLGIVK